MSNTQRSSHGLILENQNLAVASFPFMYMPFQGPTYGPIGTLDGSTTVYDQGYDHLNGQASAILDEGSMNITGTLGGFWTNKPGWCMPTSTNLNRVNPTLASAMAKRMKEFLRMDNLNAGGFIIAFELSGQTAIPTSAQYILDACTNAAGNGWGVQIFDKSSLLGVRCMYQGLGAGFPSAFNDFAPGLALDGVVHHIFIYIDVKGLRGIQYHDGYEKNSAQAFPSSGTGLPTAGLGADGLTDDTTYAPVLLARQTNVATFGTQLNIGATDNNAIRNLWIIRCTTDVWADLGNIAIDMAQRPNQFPRSLL